MASLFEEYRWRKADNSIWLQNCPDHQDLTLIYGRIYTVGENYRFSDTNNQIMNLKINPLEEHRLHYKRSAINKFSSELTAILQSQLAGRAMALIPIPPSKTAAHPEYDDRIVQVAKSVAGKLSNVRCWPILDSRANRDSSHLSNEARSIESIYSTLQINSALSADFRDDEILCVLDDVLTSGASFSASRKKLLEQFPVEDVMGMFWAKSQYPDLPQEDEF